MRLTFLGTRGNIRIISRRHRRHSSVLVRHARVRVMIDCGADWLGRVRRVKPTGIVLTHAHGDHVDGLKEGVPCPVYGTSDVWDRIRKWPIAQRAVIPPHARIAIDGILLEPVAVRHSILAPAVGYRLGCDDRVVFYVPDVLEIPTHVRALTGVDVYIGDGAALRRPIQRHQNGNLAGHASIATQLQWCADAGVRRAIFTHCGTAIVANGRDAEAAVAALGRSFGIETSVAFDGLQIRVG